MGDRPTPGVVVGASDLGRGELPECILAGLEKLGVGVDRVGLDDSPRRHRTAHRTDLLQLHLHQGSAQHLR